MLVGFNLWDIILTEAIANMDDDGIMLQIYDNIGDELKAKNKMLENTKQKVWEISTCTYWKLSTTAVWILYIIKIKLIYVSTCITNFFIPT